jgi:hypothetical protein
VKRKAAGDDGDSAAFLASTDWKQENAAGTLRKMTVTNLKIYCRAHSLPLSGKKADVLARVEENINAQP